MYHIVTDHAFQVESILTYHRISGKKCTTWWLITLSIYNTYIKHDFIILYVEKGSFIAVDIIYTEILSNIYGNFWFYFRYNLCTLHIPEVRFAMKLRSWYATMWYTPLVDTPLCDTPLLVDTPLCDTPDEMVIINDTNIPQRSAV